MKTVRLSRQLKWDIEKNIEQMFDKVNPAKDFPAEGVEILQRYGVLNKVNETMKWFKDTWDRDINTREISTLKITSMITKTHPEAIDGEGIDRGSGEEDQHFSYKMDMPPVVCPTFLLGDSYYDHELEMKVPFEDETLQKCIEIDAYNQNLRDNRRAKVNMAHDLFQKKDDEGNEMFTTLNQLLKAAPQMADFIPKERIQKMHEKDDRSARRKAQAELAGDELQGLQELALEEKLTNEDSFFGDD